MAASRSSSWPARNACHAAGVLPHPVELGGELLVEFDVGLGLVPGDGILLEAWRDDLADPRPVGLPSSMSAAICRADCSADARPLLAMPPITWSFWRKNWSVACSPIFQVARRVCDSSRSALQRLKLLAHAAHQPEDRLLLLAHLAQQPRAQQVLLGRRGGRSGGLLGLAVEGLEQGPGLGEVPGDVLPRARGEVAPQLRLERLVLPECLAEPLGLANPFGLVLGAEAPGP